MHETVTSLLLSSSSVLNAEASVIVWQTQKGRVWTEPLHFYLIDTVGCTNGSSAAFEGRLIEDNNESASFQLKSALLNTRYLLGLSEGGGLVWPYHHHHHPPPPIETLLPTYIWISSMEVFLLSGPSFKKTSWFRLNYLIKDRWIKHEPRRMNELKSCHSVLSLIPVNPVFFFVLLLFTAHIPQPGWIWNTKVWPLLHLTHLHTSTRSDKSNHHAVFQSSVRTLMNIDVFLLSWMISNKPCTYYKSILKRQWKMTPWISLLNLSPCMVLCSTFLFDFLVLVCSVWQSMQKTTVTLHESFENKITSTLEINEKVVGKYFKAIP